MKKVKPKNITVPVFMLKTASNMSFLQNEGHQEDGNFDSI